MKLFHALAFLTALALSFSALAADVSPEYERLAGNKRGILWEEINTADTTVEAFWTGGCGIMEVSGTQATLDIELQWGAISGTVNDIDSDTKPDGLRFNSAADLGAVGFLLPAGYVDIKFTSAGSSTQDVDIRLIPVDQCR